MLYYAYDAYSSMAHKRKPIRQEDPFGCGIACVAYVSHVSYRTAMARYFKSRNGAATGGYPCRDLVDALARSGRKYAYRRVRGRNRLENGSIVFIKRSARYPSGHYLVKAASGWIDPWINFSAKTPNIKSSKAGIRKRLPGKPMYAISEAHAANTLKLQ